MRFSETIDMGNGNVAHVCGDRPRPRSCQFCRQRVGANQCDFQTGGPCKKCKGAGKLDPIELLIKERRITRAQADHPDSSLRDIARQIFPEDLQCHPCAGTGKAMCNRYFCGTHCGVRVSESEGYCPDHMQLAGYSRKLVRESCQWLEHSTVEGKCLRKVCSIVVQLGDRCLYFPERRRAMCAACGQAYLLASEVIET